MRGRILAYLRDHPEGVDDDELTRALNLKYRQQANSRCRQLAADGIVERRRVRGKIRNFLVDPEKAFAPRVQPEPAEDRPWFWEGNVQDVVIRYLRSQRYRIVSFADTASRQPGKDIEAERDGVPLWVTVKGYPEGTARTHPSTQAGHWFKDALFDIVLWRGESETAELALAMPDFPRYRDLAEKVAWLQPVARFFYIWVREDGSVVLEPDG
ncbi:MAG TPA: MarR family transcriptional regulator [Anaerolineae bacterium]|nr:MarR family transcriptional regulator [Anaerolineae bacterium]